MLNHQSPKVGFIGWRGMVGSVLQERLLAEDDFSGFSSFYFSTSDVGGCAPAQSTISHLLDARNISELSEMDFLVSCQGGDFTHEIYSQLRKSQWRGHWIDAASTLRLDPEAVIVLDPVNRDLINNAHENGCRTWVGGNCTVSLMLMATQGLYQENLVEWMSAVTYQAASGAGAKHMKELIQQMGFLYAAVEEDISAPSSSILDIDKKISESFSVSNFPKQQFGVPLAGSAIPWIDQQMDTGQTREEWKGQVETNKILGIGSNDTIPIDGYCARIGSMRCHSQALLFKLRKNLPLDAIEEIIASANPWVSVIPNTPEDTKQRLTPAALSGSLDVAIGRIRKMNMGSDYIGAFTCGDQLLWGAAEPLRRILLLLLDRLA